MKLYTVLDEWEGDNSVEIYTSLDEAKVAAVAAVNQIYDYAEEMPAAGVAAIAKIDAWADGEENPVVEYDHCLYLTLNEHEVAGVIAA